MTPLESGQIPIADERQIAAQAYAANGPDAGDAAAQHPGRLSHISPPGRTLVPPLAGTGAKI